MHKTRAQPGSVVAAPIIALGAEPSKPAPRTERTAAPTLAEAAARAASKRGASAELGDTFALPVEVLRARMEQLTREAPAASAERRSTAPRSRDRSVSHAARRTLSRAWAEAPLRRKALIVVPLVAVLALGTALAGGQHADASATTPVVRAVPSKTEPDDGAARSLEPRTPAARAAHPPPGPGITPERAAADAAAEGRYAEAAERYAQLARAEPEREVWREAARILRERSAGNRTTPSVTIR